MVPESSSSNRAQPETLASAREVISKKWSATVLRTLLRDGPQGFSELETRYEQLSAKVLTDVLDSLQESAVIERRVLQESPLRVEYLPTDHGRAFEPVIDALDTWAQTMIEDSTTIVLADDDDRLVEMHTNWLSEFEIKTATDGKTARDALDETVDVLITDRRMPELSGEELAQYVATSGYDCRTVFVSSVGPDQSLCSVPFDGYVQKPAAPEKLQTVIDDVVARKSQPPKVREFESLQARIELFESQLPKERRKETEAYRNLCDRLLTLDRELDQSMTDSAAGEVEWVCNLETAHE